jgi:DNA-binding IscR family transcriptional regulator
MTTKPADATKALYILKAVADAIKELGTVPSGDLYAHLMRHGISLEVYEKIIARLRDDGLIFVSSGHLITWKGGR